MVRILVADPHAVVRVGVRALVEREPGMVVVGEAADGPTVLRLCEELDPDLVVTEVTLPGLPGAEVAARLCATRPDRKILALTAREEPVTLRTLVGAGALGYVLKRSGTDELVSAIRAVAGGAAYLDPAVSDGTRVPARAADPVALSQREREVVRLIALGYSNKEIAGQLQVSVKTVETYKTRSMEKLGTRSRVAIVRFAAEQGWLKDPESSGTGSGADPLPPTASGDDR